MAHASGVVNVAIGVRLTHPMRFTLVVEQCGNQEDIDG
jgi:hypothetical protein